MEEYYKYNPTDNGENYIIISIDWDSLKMTYTDRSKDGFKTWGKFFIDTHGKEHFKSTAYDSHNTDVYRDQDIKVLPVLEEIKPRLYEVLDKHDMLIEYVEPPEDNESPF